MRKSNLIVAALVIGVLAIMRNSEPYSAACMVLLSIAMSIENKALR